MTNYKSQMKKLLFFLMALLSLAACQTQQSAKVYGRYVPERKDDFAWENEYAAFRMYGAALKPENPSNGVDLWLKNSPALVVDTMYGRELKDNRPYHINYDGNLDCYKVAHTCGAGGLVVLTTSNNPEQPQTDQTWIGGPYDRWQILEQSPERFVFRLEYDSLLVADQILRETITITAQAGQMLNRADVVLTSNNLEQSQTISNLLAGGGIYLHDTIDKVEYVDAETIRYTEDALSDKQAARMNYEYNGSTSQGRITLTVRTPGATRTESRDGNLIAVRPYQLGDTLTYFFGATWSEWHKQ
jgi:hypothetical protein